MTTARLFLGVDGGQSSTKALIGDVTGTILGAGTGGPCNHAGVAEGPAKLKRVILECVGRACEQAGLEPNLTSFESVCFGMSGGPDDKQDLLAEVLRATKIVVTDDAVIALAGAFGGGPGVVTIAGTGSIALARHADGRRARAGGWGYVFGDEGGAFDIVRQALRAALRHEEGWAPATVLRGMLLEKTGAVSANGLLHAFYTIDWPRSRVAALAPLVSSAAQAGDEIAVQIINRAGGELASFALAARNQLWGLSGDVAFSYIGGAFRSPRLLEAFRSAVEFHSGCRVSPPMLGAAAGALVEAYKAGGISPDLNKLLTSNF